ncbi:MAG: endonuclease [Bacteroidia bacterium]
MRPITTCLILCLGLLAACRTSPENEQSDDKRLRGGSGRGLLIGFYNVENLFDAVDDSLIDEIEFVPGSELDWTEEKYFQKQANMAEAIAAMGERGPDVLGVAEVENLHVLEDLVAQEALAGRKYAIVHEESPDLRGIDVALIYDPVQFRYRQHATFRLSFPEEPDYISRDILWVEGEVKGEPLHLIVNHWPSRRDGPEVSEARRMVAARKVAAMVAEIRSRETDPAIVIMGDFNDDPRDRSITEVLMATGDSTQVATGGFYNPMYRLHDPERQGTLTYQGKWNLFDQILLNEDLLDQDGRLVYKQASATIHNPDFMQVGGDGRSKDAPRRAIYRGAFQERGFSDHFPVYLRLHVR